jgi:hypothetical protein
MTTLRRALDVNKFSNIEQEIAELAAESIDQYEPRIAITPEVQPPLLATRQTTHGEFGDNARVSQALKRIFRGEPGWELLTDTERESMDMIALKFSRILSGKSLELQHWEDVVGYAQLAEKLCKNRS